MPKYQFQAMNACGEEIRDTIDAATEDEAQTSIRQLGYFVTKISEVRKPAESNDPQRASSMRSLAIMLSWLGVFLVIFVLCGISVRALQEKAATETKKAEVAAETPEKPKFISRSWHGNGVLPNDFYIPADSTGEYIIKIQSDNGADRREWKHVYEIISRNPLKFVDPASGNEVELVPLANANVAVIEFKKHPDWIMERLQKGEKVLHPNSYDSTEDAEPPPEPIISNPF